MDNNSQPSGLELQILNVLWERGPSTVRAVLDLLSDGKARAYTTVLSTMQVMERKGQLKRAGMVSGALVYEPALTRNQVTKPALRNLIAGMFDGKASAVVQRLLADRMVDDEELAEIRRLLDEHGTAKPMKTRTPGKAKGKS